MILINKFKEVLGIKKILISLLLTLVFFSCIGCVDTDSSSVYVYSEDPSKELYLLSYNDFILVGPSGFSGSYVIHDNKLHLGTDYTQITLTVLDNGTLVDTDGELWYCK